MSLKEKIINEKLNTTNKKVKYSLMGIAGSFIVIVYSFIKPNYIVYNVGIYLLVLFTLIFIIINQERKFLKLLGELDGEGN